MYLGRSLVDLTIFTYSPYVTRLQNLVLTSADGESIFATVQATYEPGADLYFGGVFTGTVTFTGGTGRFESVSGGAAFVMAVELYSWHGGYALALDGRITF